jgi:O-6-methylguanine DNA methyltransferase
MRGYSAFDRNGSRLPGDMAKQVQDHLTGRRRFSGRIDLSCLTPFQQRVLRKIRTIPTGQVRSYQWVAKEIGAERAARAVGTALARNPIPLLIPCHRVVRSDGVWEYSGGGPSVKRAAVSTRRRSENLTRCGAAARSQNAAARVAIAPCLCSLTVLRPLLCGYLAPA